MKITPEILALQSTRPDLFDRDPREGLAAVEKAILSNTAARRALGVLRRSYQTRIARSPVVTTIPLPDDIEAPDTDADDLAEYLASSDT